MEERKQYSVDLESMIEDCETVIQLLQAVKRSLVIQAIAMEDAKYSRPRVGDDVHGSNTCESIKRKILVCREMLLEIRKKVDT